MTDFKTDATGDYITARAGEMLDYDIDLTAWLNGDAITGSAWTADTGALIVDMWVVGGKVSVFLDFTGAQKGQVFTVANIATTVGVSGHPRKKVSPFRIWMI